MYVCMYVCICLFIYLFVYLFIYYCHLNLFERGNPSECIVLISKGPIKTNTIYNRINYFKLFTFLLVIKKEHEDIIKQFKIKNLNFIFYQSVSKLNFANLFHTFGQLIPAYNTSVTYTFSTFFTILKTKFFLLLRSWCCELFESISNLTTLSIVEHLYTQCATIVS